MKKLFTLLLGLGTLFSAYAAPMDDPIPSASDLTAAGYDVTNNVVLCIRFTEDAKVCNNIYFNGSFRSWAANFSGCPQFTELASFPGWYAAEAAYEADFQGKPMQAGNDKDLFSWNLQCGDPDAWIHMGESKATITGSYGSESTVAFGAAGAYVYELKYWKKHASPCPKSLVTVNVLVPSDCGMDVSNGLWLCWCPNYNTSDTHIIKMSPQEDRHFEVSFNPNAGSFSYCVMNAESKEVDGMHCSYYWTYIYTDTHCCELNYSATTYHNMFSYDNCSSHKNHNYMPSKMLATPLNKDSVKFTWEMVDQALNFQFYAYDENDNEIYIGNYYYQSEQGNTCTFAMNTAKSKTFAYWRMNVYSDYLGEWVYFANQGNGFTVEGNEAIPDNLLVTDNGDGSYTFNWDCKGTVDHYYVYVDKTSPWVEVKSESVTDKSYTINLDAGINYYFEVASYNADDKLFGYTYIYFDTKSVASHDIAAYVYVPQASGVPALNNCYVQWWYEGFAKNTVALVNEGNNWYRADFKGLTKEKVYFKVMNAAKEEDATLSWTYGDFIKDTTYFILNKNQQGKLQFRKFNKAYYRHDYCAHTIKVEASAGKAIVSFKTNEEADQYYIAIYDKNGNYMADRWIDAYSVDYEAGVAFYLSNEKDATCYASVRASGDGGASNSAATVYSQPFKAPASPFVLKNLKATDNGDCTYTLSWDPIDSKELDHYAVFMYDPDDYYSFGMGVGEENKAVTPLLFKTGTYEFYVEAYNAEGRELCSNYTTFTVDPIAPRDVTVRALIHKDCGYNLDDGLKIYFYNSSTDEWDSKDATYEGNNWFSYKHNTADRIVTVKLGDNEFNIIQDTCFQLFPDGEWDYAACDAEAQDHNITPGSLTANSRKGAVDFSWSAPTQSTEYYVLIYDASNEATIASGYISGTTCQYIVPAENDGKEIGWKVRPSEPYALDFVKATATVTLQKTDVVISNLQTTTNEDSVTFHMSWECNKENLKYEVYVYGNYDYWKHDTVATTSYDYTMPTNGQFYWGVYPLDPAENDGYVGGWNGIDEYIYLRKVPAPISDLKADVNNKQITFTWKRSNDDIIAMARLYRIENGSQKLIEESNVDAAEWKYTVDKEGLYALKLSAYVEYEPGKYTYLYVGEVETTAQVFLGKTYKLTVNAGNGGYIEPENISGQYGEGFKIYIEALAEANYRFVEWSDGVKTYGRTITMNSDLTLTAYFELLPKHTLKVEATEGGEIYLYEMDNWDTSYEGEFYEGSIYVRSRAKSGYGFYGWSDGKTSQNRYINLVSDSSVTAIFKPLRTVTLGAAVNGSIIYSGSYYSKDVNVYTVLDGTQITITAKADDGYRFKEWNDGVAYAVRDVVITTDTTFSPTFVDAGTDKKCHVEVGANSGGTATIIDADFYEGDILQLSAKADDGYTFTGWDNGVTENNFELVVSQDTTIYAQFEIKQFTLTVNAGAGGRVRVEYGDKVESFTKQYEYDSYVYVQTYADKHYHFVKWSDGSTNANRGIYVEKDMTLTAEFELDQFLITFLNDDGSFIEAKQWAYGSTPKCSVTPKKAETAQYTYEFKGWDPAITAVTQAATYKATYKATEKGGGGSGEGGGSGDGGGSGSGDGGGSKPDQALDNIDANTPAIKIFRDGTLYILRGDKVYTAQGQLVK